MNWETRDGRRLVLVYDGRCRFCISGARRLAAWGRPGSIELVDRHDEAAMAAHRQAPSTGPLTMTLVAPDGRVACGAEAAFRALATRPAWRLVTWLYWVPGLHQFYNAVYALIARNRYRIMGRVDACESGACAVEPIESRPG